MRPLLILSLALVACTPVPPPSAPPPTGTLPQSAPSPSAASASNTAPPSPTSTPLAPSAAPPSARFLPEPDAHAWKWTVGRLSRDQESYPRICQAWARFGPIDTHGLQPTFRARDSERHLALGLSITSEGWIELNTDAPQRLDDAARTELLASMRTFLDGAPPLDCTVEVRNGSVLRIMGMRDGKPFVAVAPFRRTLAVLLARPIVVGPPDDYSSWGLHRDDELLGHWKSGTDAERTENEPHLPEIQQAARRLLALDPMSPGMLSDIGRQGYCLISAELAKAAKLTSPADKALVAAHAKRFCRK